MLEWQKEVEENGEEIQKRGGRGDNDTFNNN